MSRFRVMTFNVRRCVGAGGRDSTGDIAALCAAASADLIALQELDAPETDDTEGAHHARDLAQRLGMNLLFCRTFRRGVGYYGHALLCRFSVELVRATTFPPCGERSEPRGAIWGKATHAGKSLHVISTHLGVRRRERRMQSQELLGENWLGNPDFASPAVLCGDLNSIARRSTTYKRFASHLHDVQMHLEGHRPRATFPARYPVMRIDHVFVTPDVRVVGIDVPYNSLSRRASDHLPLIVDLELR